MRPTRPMRPKWVGVGRSGRTGRSFPNLIPGGHPVSQESESPPSALQPSASFIASALGDSQFSHCVASFSPLLHFPQIWIVIFWNSRPVWAAREQVVAKAVDDGLWRGVSTPRPSPRTYLRAGCTRRQCPVDFAADREKTLTKRAMDVSRAVQNLRRWTVT
jgi:hypothetical protein